MKKNKVMLIADKRNWAYDSIAKSLNKYNNNTNFDLIIDYIKNPIINLKKNYEEYDLFFFLGWQSLFTLKNNKIINNFNFLDKQKIICGIHSHHSWDDKKTTPNHDEQPPSILIDHLNTLKSVNVVSKRLFNLFKKYGCENLNLTLNGVDHELFSPKPYNNYNEKLKVGYSGTIKHDWRKGISEFIKPSCEINNVELVMAAPDGTNNVNLEDMPNFYKSIDVYLCASSSEGFSLSVLEASSSGKPIISSKVGGSTELIKNGINGFLVNRDITEIQEKLIYLRDNREELKKMSLNSRKIIVDNWTWELRSKEWLNFIESNIAK